MSVLKDVRFLLKELKSNECACGKPKKSGNSFCYNCYTSLPMEMQKPLYRKFGQGYEEAYEEAYQWLKDYKWGD